MTGYASAPPTVDLPSLLPSSLLARGDDAGAPGRRRTVRDWIVDVTCFLLAVSFGLTLLFTQEESGTRSAGSAVLALDLALGLASCLALWWRRRWPVAIAVILTPIGGFSAVAALAVTIMVFTVAVHRPAKIAVAIAAANVATVPVYFLLRATDDEPFWIDLVIGTLITAVVLGWGMFARARRQLVGSLRDRAMRAETEQQLRVDQARRLERTRIAREMHDVLAHRISLVSVHAGALEFRTDATREQVTEAAGVIRANAHQALQELREVIGVLREEGTRPAGEAGAAGASGAGHVTGEVPGAVPAGAASAPEPPQPGLAEIPALVAESTQAGARVRYRCELSETAEVPGSIARTAYRVIQEGLTNARKHAPGAPIDVVLTGDPECGLRVEIRNPMPSWPIVTTVPGSGLGLVGLSERVQLAGGRLDHERTADDRFVLTARLPWRR